MNLFRDYFQRDLVEFRIGSVNSSFISLIPKESRPELLERFRPSTATKVGHSKQIGEKELHSRPGRRKGAFIKDRSITENICCVQEAIYEAKRGKRRRMIVRTWTAHMIGEILGSSFKSSFFNNSPAFQSLGLQQW